MGASAWTSQVPFQPDIGAALQEARWNAYRSGGYYRPSPDPQARAMSEDEYVDWFESTYDTKAYDEVRQEWRAAQIEPVDPDSLLASQPFSGTHSVIDMTHVASQPESQAVAPPSDDDFAEIFGTSTPTTEQVQDALDILDLHGRWYGTYVIGYQNGQPHTVYFVGHSGD